MSNPTTGGTRPIARGHIAFYNPAPEPYEEPDNNTDNNTPYYSFTTGGTYSFTIPATSVPVYQSFQLAGNTTIQGSTSNGTTADSGYIGIKYTTSPSTGGSLWYASDTSGWTTLNPSYTFADTTSGHVWRHINNEEWTAITKEEREKLDKANKKSMELLKEWLSEAEYNYLMERGELEIPSQIHDDEIYIIKKSAYEKVIKKKAGKKVSAHCLITEGHFPDGDVLLTKILLLKTNEQEFLEKAIMSAIV